MANTHLKDRTGKPGPPGKDGIGLPGKDGKDGDPGRPGRKGTDAPRVVKISIELDVMGKTFMRFLFSDGSTLDTNKVHINAGAGTVIYREDSDDVSFRPLTRKSCGLLSDFDENNFNLIDCGSLPLTNKKQWFLNLGDLNG